MNISFELLNAFEMTVAPVVVAIFDEWFIVG